MMYIGIDGGGSSSRYCLMGEDGQVIKTSESTATNISSHGKIFVEESLKKGLEELLQDVADRRSIPICLATAGVDQAADILPYVAILEQLGFDKVKVVNDGEGALSAGTKGQDGIIAIAGTGSIVLGRHENQLARVGGWGHMIGDEGSGYAIAIDGIKAVLRAFDGYGQSTSLSQGLLTKIEGQTPSDFITFIYHKAFNKDRIAQLAQIVDDHANRGDQVAIEILRHQAGLLAEQVKALKTTLFKETPSTLVLNGSVAKHSKIFRKSLEISLADQAIELVDLEVCASVGAAYLARNMEVA